MLKYQQQIIYCLSKELYKDTKLHKGNKLVSPFAHQNNMLLLLLQIQLINWFPFTFQLSLQGQYSWHLVMV